MARYTILLSLSFSILVLFHTCSAQIEQVTSQSRQQQQRFQTQCNIKKLKALRSHRQIESEAGFTEFWDQSSEELQCADVAVLRHTIKSRGLLVPSYTNVPQLIYVLQGNGLHSAVFPGCPETYQYSQQEETRGGSEGQFQGEQHQKVRTIEEGDVLFVPPGVAHWIFNPRQSDLIVISLYDVGNAANQLDPLFRKFFLAGSPPEEFQGTSQSQSQSQSRSWSEGERRHHEQSKGRQGEGGNILRSFDPDFLAQAMNVDKELIDRMQRYNPHRGVIIRVQGKFRVLTPHRQGREEEGERQEEEEEERYPGEQEERRTPEEEEGGQEEEGDIPNGLEETLCTIKLKHNVRRSHTADLFNPRAGRTTSVNAHTLPILHRYQLSLEHTSLYRNAFYAPHWNVNAHSIVFIVSGDGRIQVTSESGDRVFDEEVKEGQLLVIPQGYAALKQAGNNGLKWIAFKTNGFAKISQVVGRGSTFSGLPVDVLANAFGVSREQASRVKNSRWELTLFSPSSSRHQSPRRREDVDSQHT